jgi:hypothetical protein
MHIGYSIKNIDEKIQIEFTQSNVHSYKSEGLP